MWFFLLRSLLVLMIMLPVRLQAASFPGTRISYIDVYHAAVDQSVHVVVAIDTYCRCPDTVILKVDSVTLSDENYEYRFEQRFILSGERVFSFTLTPYLNSSDWRGLSIYLLSEESVLDSTYTILSTLLPQDSSYYEFEMSKKVSARHPYKSRYTHTSGWKDHYHQFEFISNEIHHRSPVIPITGWRFHVTPADRLPPTLQGMLELSLPGPFDEFVFPIRLVKNEENVYILEAQHSPGLIHPDSTLTVNSSYQLGDLLFAFTPFATEIVEYHLWITSFGSQNVLIKINGQLVWEEPLVGKCDSSLWCIHNYTTPLITTIEPYYVGRIGG